MEDIDINLAGIGRMPIGGFDGYAPVAMTALLNFSSIVYSLPLIVLSFIFNLWWACLTRTIRTTIIMVTTPMRDQGIWPFAKAFVTASAPTT